MANDIPTGLRVPSQAPLDYKTYSQSEAALQNLGVDNQLAYTYHKGLRVTCILERTNWEWKEMEVGDVGLLPANFIYPNGLIVEGIDYSNKEYNFVNTAAPLAPLEKVEAINGYGIIVRDRISTNYGNVGLDAVDLSVNYGTSSTRGATGRFSFTANKGNTASADSAASLGSDNISSGASSFTAGRDNTASFIASIALGNNNQSIRDNTIALGNSTIASGLYAITGGTAVYARSWGEISLGTYNTDYTPLSPISFDPLDRIFNIGNGSNAFGRSDAFTILKNGLATLPSVTNALITAGSVKSVITKEYLSLYPLDTNVLHKTGDESWEGIKSSTNPGFPKTNGLSLINNGGNGTESFFVQNNNGGIGIHSYNVLGGKGIYSYNQGNGYGIYSINVGTGVGITSNSDLASTGFVYTGQNNGTNTFTVNKLGDITANKFIKSGGTSTQYLMADGSVTTAGATIQSIIITGSWTLNGGYVVDTTLGLGKTLISVTPTLVCTVANNGYAVGDIVNISATQANDSGGLADSGVGIRFIPSVSDRFTFNVNDRLDISNCYNGSVGTGGAISDPAQAIPSQWNMRTVILYI